MFDANRWDDRDTHYWPSFHVGGNGAESTGKGRPIMAWNLRHGAGSAGGLSQPARQQDALGESSVTDADRAPAGLMWVDAVGGFLVYLADEVSIGQAVPGAKVDLPILGDLSRRHAILIRDGEDYLVDPVGPVSVEGNTIIRPTRLADGDEIGLGSRVRLRFRQPNALSNTARLDILSHHRTQPSADGILLLAETCLLGPTDENHIVCRNWPDQVILTRTPDGRFRFKAGKTVSVDGVATCDTGTIDWGARIASEDFALSLERL